MAFNILLPDKANALVAGLPKCVIKIKVGAKFYIGRAAGYKFVCEELIRAYSKYKHKGGIYESHLYYPIVKYMVSSGIDEIEIENIFESESGYEVLKQELIQLEKHFGKRNCLNQNNIPHVPKFKTPSTPNKWLTHNEFLNFKKLLARYEY